MNAEILIGNQKVGIGQDPFVVAEVGINHNGELSRALEMIHVAKAAGCDAIKFQTFTAEEFVNDSKQLFTYFSQGKQVTEPMLQMFKRYELPKTAWSAIKDECDQIGIQFLSTPQNKTDLDVLLDVGVPAVKIGSDDLTNLPLLKSYATCGLPLILSTGMSDLAEAYQALEAVGALDGYPVALLVCTSQYPTPAEDANLARITALRGAFPNVPIGFSDHTSGALAAPIAVALGAVLFEKHFTLDQNLPGPDHWFSEDPESLAEWVNAIRVGHRMLGNALVRPTGAEQINKREFQRRIVASRDIDCGEIITDNALVFRRVAGGRGLPPSFLNYLLGRPAPKSYITGQPIEL